MDFYYDKLLNSDYATYRVWGQKLGESTTGESVKTGTSSQLLSSPECIVRDIIREPLSMTISHNFAYASSSSLEQLTIIKDNVKASLKNIQKGLSDLSGSVLANLFHQWTDSELTVTADRFLQIIPPQDFFKVFEGTKVELSLNFRARLYKRKLKDDNSYKTPISLLKDINSYFMGSYFYSGSALNANNLADSASSTTDLLMYTPPHGYLGLAAEGWKPSGTLTLFYGKSLVIEDLLLQNYSFTFSRETLPEGGPLYIDLSFSLLPAILFTVRDVNKITESLSKISTTSDRQYLGSSSSSTDLVEVDDWST